MLYLRRIGRCMNYLIETQQRRRRPRRCGAVFRENKKITTTTNNNNNNNNTTLLSFCRRVRVQSEQADRYPWRPGQNSVRPRTVLAPQPLVRVRAPLPHNFVLNVIVAVCLLRRISFVPNQFARDRITVSG